MREIKFRAIGRGGVMRSWDDLQKFHIHTIFTMAQPDLKLMQYTGLTDKNGVEIYEGDLVRILSPKIRFNEKQCCLVEFKNAYVGGWVLTHPATTEWLSLGARGSEEIRVIGNIYQNPELLEG